MKSFFDYIIIGAGIIGISIAREIAKREPSSKIKILEKEKEVGLHSSGRNSGVIHSGIYYEPSSLKAKVCSSGAKLLSEFCDENKLSINKIGKIILPTKESDLEQLHLLYDRAINNKINVSWLNEKDILSLEPHINASMQKALFVSDTAVADPLELLRALLKETLSENVSIDYCDKVIDVSLNKKRLIMESGANFYYGKVINAAGLYADKICHKFGIGAQYTIIPFKGVYWKLDPASGLSFNHLIYPVPDLRVPFLGVHTTTSIDGDVFIGPTAIPAFGRENYNGLNDFNLPDFFNINRAILSQLISNKDGFRKLLIQEGMRYSKPFFLNAGRKLIPKLKSKHLIKSSKVGIRAQLFDLQNKRLENDFLVIKEHNSIHILNAISPAWTSSMALSDLIVSKYILT